MDNENPKSLIFAKVEDHAKRQRLKLVAAAKKAQSKKNHNSGCGREVVVDVKTKSKNGKDKASMFKTSFREAVPFLLLIGSWVWFFSAQSAEIKINSKSIEQLSVAIKDISAIVTEYRIKSSSVDEHLRSIDSSLVDIKDKLDHNSFK